MLVRHVFMTGIESRRGQQLRRPLAITKSVSAAGQVTGPVMAPRILDDMPTSPRWRLTRGIRSKVSIVLTGVSKSVIFPMFLGIAIRRLAKGR